MMSNGLDFSVINGDMQRRVALSATAMQWQQAPHGSVWRKRLHLVGPREAGQVTSLVRYEPNSEFPEHGHPEGEEIFVLDGMFHDEHRVSPAGTYLLHPEGFRHRPASPEGCLLFVKLRQYAGEARDYVTLDTQEMQWQASEQAGIEVKVLYKAAGFPDRTRLERWAPSTSLEKRVYPGGAEIFLLSGTLVDEKGTYDRYTWLRLPADASHAPHAPHGCEFYIKTGALPDLASVVDGQAV
jgi:anti-sigma factor ChrR (cupin superfamily)